MPNRKMVKKNKLQTVIVLLLILFISLILSIILVKEKSNISAPDISGNSLPELEDFEARMKKVNDAEKDNNYCISILTETNSQTILKSDKDTGFIKGYISYASEGFPRDIQACAYNITTGTRYCSTDFTDDKTGRRFQIIVPPGKYYVYSAFLSPGRKDVIGLAETTREYLEEIDRFVVLPTIYEVNGGGKIEYIDIGDNMFCRGMIDLYCEGIY